MRNRLVKLLPLLALVFASAVQAEDIDLFVGTPSTSTDLPNVLFVIDNTANWNQAFTNEMSALAATFEKMENDKFNVGIMLATETGSPNNNVKGGYVRAAFRTINGSTRGQYKALIESLDKLADKGDGGYSALTMVEAYRYITGGVPYAGNYKVKADFTGNRYGTRASTDVYALSANALDSIGDTSYRGVSESSCAKTFIIYISNGPNQQNSSTDSLANTFLSQAGGSATPIAISPTGSQSNPSDEWARFMLSKNIITYAIDVNPTTNGQGPGWTRLLQSMASDTNGNLVPNRYKAVKSTTNNGQEIADAINGALTEIQDVNSVFASVSLPLSVNAQGTYLNQVYVGLFRPDKDAYPRWAGNLKQYKLGYVDGGDLLRLLDSKDKSAINPLTGFVAGCALSFWTPDAKDSYWSFRPQGTCTGSEASDSPDGNVVEKGAQSYVARKINARSVLKTCIGKCSSGGLSDFTTTNAAITAGLLGANSSNGEREKLIDWARGIDVDDENRDNARGDVRASVHGDVVHSRPVALNFGTADTPQVVVFYGGNDGVFRAINGNRDTNVDGTAPGGELWSFMPPEFFDDIKRLRDNSIKVSFPNVTTGSPLPKPYGIDGLIAAYRADAASAWVYASMRRGGRALYAFNVDVDDPSDIALKWKVGCTSNFASDGTTDSSSAACTTGIGGIGQTWAQPKIVKTAASSSPLLIMGGGYDPCEDGNPNTCGATSKGKQVFVLDADTGSVLATLPTDRGVIAEVSVVTNASGLAEFAYVVDLGGNVYRIDIGTAAPSAWTMTKIASLGCDSATSCARNRKFMFAPDILWDNGAYVLLLGSGDREKPRNYADTVQNYFFMLKDKPNDSTWLGSEATNCGSELLCLNSLLPITGSSSPTAEQLAAMKGWYLPLDATEQVVTAAITIFGTVTFSSHLPDIPTPGLCKSNLGTARVYNINYLNAAPANGTKERYEELPGEIGLPPSPVAGAVQLDNGETVPFCIGCDPESPLQATEPEVPASSVPSEPKSRVYWYIQR